MYKPHTCPPFTFKEFLLSLSLTITLICVDLSIILIFTDVPTPCLVLQRLQLTIFSKGRFAITFAVATIGIVMKAQKVKLPKAVQLGVQRGLKQGLQVQLSPSPLSPIPIPQTSREGLACLGQTYTTNHSLFV